jgi:peptide/nickel transport system substrate-binding protein
MQPVVGLDTFSMCFAPPVYRHHGALTELAIRVGPDPDAQFYENYSCGALRNYTGYCDRSVDELIDRQSRETNADKRRQLVWQIERELIEEDARPDILYVRGITCRRPYVQGLISMVNSIYNGSRFEGVWLAN